MCWSLKPIIDIFLGSALFIFLGTLFHSFSFITIIDLYKDHRLFDIFFITLLYFFLSLKILISKYFIMLTIEKQNLLGIFERESSIELLSSLIAFIVFPLSPALLFAF